MRHIVKIHKKDEVISVNANEGANLLELLRENNIHLNTPCGGKGTCGKCTVRVTGLKDEPTDKEKSLLGEEKLKEGYRLACMNVINSNLEIIHDDDTVEASIITGGKSRNITINPIVKKQYIEMDAPALDDQASDIERVQAVSGLQPEDVEISLLSDLPLILRSSGYKVTLASTNEKIISIEKGDTTNLLYGTAFDIGTTTVAAYLYDLNTGELKAVSSMLNPQKKYGADVITRISYAKQSEKNNKEMQQLTIDCINELTSQLAKKAGIPLEVIYAAVFAGNTTMLHFLMGLDAQNMAVSPFIPVTTSLQRFRLNQLGINMNQNGIGAAFPGVSAYVGGDTVAAVLSSGMYEEDGVFLLVDIGTNGEIVLGGKEGMLACSTAAGPAFEGANIRNGVGGVTGAIDTVGPGPDFECTTIVNASPVGICGSGIVDAVARLIEAGLIDETGRFADEEEVLEINPSYGERFVDINGARAFVLVPQRKNVTGSAIVITQKDIRELQNAKAAIAAGIETLIKISGKGNGSVEKVYLAGGFGSKINISSAVKIGLLPGVFDGKIEAIGNASGSGASEGLLSADSLKLSEKIKRLIKYVELSASADFTERYVENMLF